MSASKPRITIVGLGLIGGSIGQALRQAGAASSLIGHDRESAVANQAKKLGAVDRTDWNLISACEGSDLVILAVPVAAIEATLEALGPHLKPGCVVLDTATLKAPVQAWAAEHLGDQAFFIGSDPIIARSDSGQQGIEAARADLFQGGVFCLTPSPAAHPAAVDLVTDLVTILGATPLFLAPEEHDGLVAAVDHLPAILALALLETTIHQPTWRELRRVAGASFELGTRLVSADPLSQAGLAHANRDNLVRWIDLYLRSLTSIRDALLAGQTEALAERLTLAQIERAKWLRDQNLGQWEDKPLVQMPDRPNFFVDAFLGGLGRKRRKKEEE